MKRIHSPGSTEGKLLTFALQQSKHSAGLEDTWGQAAALCLHITTLGGKHMWKFYPVLNFPGMIRYYLLQLQLQN